MKKIKSKKEYTKQILLLEWLTIAWNTVEGFVAVTIGALSGSISLVAFGLESGIEVLSSSVTVWEIKGVGNGRRKNALRAISLAFLFVSIYVAVSAIHSLQGLTHIHSTIAGIVYMFSVSIVMSILGYLKRSLGLRLKNPVIVAEANFTFLDVALSSSILAGLLLNYFFGWWWFDPIIALVIASNAFIQGIQGLNKEFTFRINKRV